MKALAFANVTIFFAKYTHIVDWKIHIFLVFLFFAKKENHEV
jgi:hypothetical protein